MLPSLREDLNLHLSSSSSNGCPNWTIHDPVRNKFFQIEWRVYEVLRYWEKGTAELIVQEVNKLTTLEIDESFIREVERFFRSNELFKVGDKQGLKVLINNNKIVKHSWLKLLLHRYLFFRIPLFKCDAFVTATLPYIKFIFSNWFLSLNVISLILGLLLVTHQWDIFISHFIEPFAFERVLIFLITLVLVKIGHEFGHAFTAKLYGCRVPVMGVAFLVLWPMFYTDTNESWKLKYQSQRFKIASAGVVVELMLASFSTLAWGLMPSGPLRDMAFIMATTTWVSSLAINASPFMRFDGYYLLSDYLNIANLHERSGNLARWWLREKLFNICENKPEIFPKRKEMLLIIFAFSVWVYRLVLFFGIALLIYSFFIKILGILLFFTEIIWFILRPVWFELKEWKLRKELIFAKKRVWLLLFSLLFIIFSLFVPWRGTIALNSVIQTNPYKVIYVKTNGRLEKFISTEGVSIKKDQLIVEFENPELNFMLKKLENKINVKKKILQLSAFDRKSWNNNAIITAELVNLKTERAALQKKIDSLNIYAPIDGMISDISRDLLVGQWLSQGHRLFAINGHDGFKVIAYLNEEDVSKVQSGGSCVFKLVQRDFKKYPCSMREIGRSSEPIIDEKMLVTQYGGDISANYERELLLPKQAVYKLVADIKSTNLKLNQKTKGIIKIETVSRNLIDRFWYWFVSVIIREGGM